MILTRIFYEIYEASLIRINAFMGLSILIWTITSICIRKYPEEFNRQATGIISQYNFAPTHLASENLINEGKSPEKIFITGNTVIDAMQRTVRDDYIHPELDWIGDCKMIFITAHRRENLSEPMHRMFRAIRRVLDDILNAELINRQMNGGKKKNRQNSL